jgi:SAM-dependent methyltransferase
VSDAPKRYDRDYFERWYRVGGVGSPAELERKVGLAVALTETVLERPLRSALDVGCGEGRWQPALGALRPEASYLGLDTSAYVVERFGGARNILTGAFEDLGGFAFEAPFDLVVCSDVLHYLTRGQIARGLERLVPLVGGVALLEAFTRSDEIEGDRDGFHDRAPATYRRWFRDAGLVPVGMQHWVRAEVARSLPALALQTPHP